MVEELPLLDGRDTHLKLQRAEREGLHAAAAPDGEPSLDAGVPASARSHQLERQGAAD